ncbi:hypothetical protein [Actinopolyspora erythraea]|uniref:hypothetical protein n=1 Tax=Actinopolyspora erythraea TaxID=414996 RepID=UPI001186E84F|nr:hypothetical protein [Actinopolyspora erythraea]
MTGKYFNSDNSNPKNPKRSSPADESFLLLKKDLEAASLDLKSAENRNEELTERFFLHDIQRIDENTAKIILFFHETPNMLARFLTRKKQPIAILYSLTFPDGRAHNLEMPSLEIHEFVSTGGANEETVRGEDNEGNLVIDARTKL